MFLKVTTALLDSFQQTLELFGLTLLFALPLGLIISFGSMSKFKPLKYLVRTFVWVIRGTPLMLQLFLFYYGPGLIIEAAEKNGTDFFFIDWMHKLNSADAIIVAAVAFIINYAAYFSEIYRGGIEGIPKGQYEAAQVLGMKKSQTFFRVILMQVVKRIVPPMSNEIITLVKDTALANTITVYEITWTAQEFVRSDSIIWPVFYSGLFYLLFSGLLTLIFGLIERKLNYYEA